MTSEVDSNKKVKSLTIGIIKLIFLIISIIVLFFLYYVLIIFKLNPLIVVLIIVFVFLLFLGPFFKDRRKKKFYSRMFPDKNKKKYQRKREIQEYYKENLPQRLTLKNIDLNIKYRKPIIRKCSNCKMIIPNFSKKCIFCGSQE